MVKADRIRLDLYETDALVTKALTDRVEINGTVLEPCCGSGQISRVLMTLPSVTRITTNDIDPTHRADFHLDASDPDSWDDAFSLPVSDWVVTNPPFSLANSITANAFRSTRKGMAMLLRLSFLEPCEKRAEFLKNSADNLVLIIPLNPRPQFRDDIKGGDKVTVCWYVWQHDFSWARLGLRCPFEFANNWKEPKKLCLKPQ